MSGARRAQAAAKYRPSEVRLLLIAEAPPDDESRYFYFEDVRAHDSLFRHVAAAILGWTPDRTEKARALEQLGDRGVFLIDASEIPLGDRQLQVDAQDVADRCRALNPEGIVLIKTTVYDALFSDLDSAGLPVINKRIPFPGSGRQREFMAAFADALAQVGWDNGGVGR